MYYRHLMSDLKTNRPIFGLQPLPLDGKHHIPRTIEAMAADYIAEIREVQPHGPYSLAGHSFGGRVSFEIAQQLARQGEHISFLGLIDTGLHDASTQDGAPVSDAARLSRRVYDLFRMLRWIGPALLKRQHDQLRWIGPALLKRQHDLRIRYGHSIPFEHRPTFYDWLCSRANLHYVATPYPGRITMFSSVGNSEQQRASWGPLARGGLTIFEIPASHDDMVLPPHSKLLAEYFDACLDETECL
jgi:thioesterase domain-containing protein